MDAGRVAHRAGAGGRVASIYSPAISADAVCHNSPDGNIAITPSSKLFPPNRTTGTQSTITQSTTKFTRNEARRIAANIAKQKITDEDKLLALIEANPTATLHTEHTDIRCARAVRAALDLVLLVPPMLDFFRIENPLHDFCVRGRV